MNFAMLDVRKCSSSPVYRNSSVHIINGKKLLHGKQSALPILSVPTTLTSRKQKGKSNTLSPRYTPIVTQPYSLDSFFNLPPRDSVCCVSCSGIACCFELRCRAENRNCLRGTCIVGRGRREATGGSSLDARGPIGSLLKIWDDIGRLAAICIPICPNQASPVNLAATGVESAPWLSRRKGFINCRGNIVVRMRLCVVARPWRCLNPVLKATGLKFCCLFGVVLSWKVLMEHSGASRSS